MAIRDRINYGGSTSIDPIESKYLEMLENPENIKLAQALEEGLSSTPVTPEPEDESDTTGSISSSR